MNPRKFKSGLEFLLLSGFFAGILFSPRTFAQPENNPDSDSKFVQVKEDILYLYVDVIDERFRNAKDLVAKKEYAEAAVEIRRAAGYLEMESGRTMTSEKNDLEASINQLKKVAEELEKGTTIAANDLDPVFARAEHALARHHFLRSTEEMKIAGDEKKVGRDMDAAAKHLERARSWTDEKIDKGTQATIRESIRVATLLRKGTGWSMDQAGDILNSLDTGIKNLGNKVKPEDLNPESVKNRMKQVLESLNTYFRENKKFPDNLSELPAGTPILDPYSFRKQFRYSVNPDSPITAVIISNGPDWKANYTGSGLNADKPTTFPKPQEVYDPVTGKGDIYLYTTGKEAGRRK